MPINVQQALNYRFNDANVASAKAQGWNDSQINAYKQQVSSDLVKQNAVEQAVSAKQAAATPQSSGNWLTKLLPSGGSIAGGLAGAAAGTMILPGIGTLIGGLAGGALGGAGGKVAENAVEGNSNIGDGVGGEALMGAATSLPFGAALKVGQAGAKLATGIGRTSVSDLLAQAGTKTIPKVMAGTADTAGSAIANAGNPAAHVGTDAMGSVLNPTLTQRLGNSLENTGTNQLMSNQVNLTRAGAAHINNGDVSGLFKTMQNNYGLSNLEDMNKVGALVTGKAGLDNGGAALTNAVENSVASGKGINVDDLKTLMSGHLDQAGAAITPADRIAVEKQVVAAQKSMYDQTASTASTAANGAATAPTNLVDPLTALSQSRALAGNASSFLERNPNVITSRDQALGKVYNGLSNDIKDRLFNSQGALGKVATPITQDAQAAVNDAVTALRGESQKYLDAGNTTVGNAIGKVADQAQGAKTISDLNAIQSPFVNTSKLANLNGLVDGGAAANVGGLKSTATGMLNGVVGDLIKPGMNTLAAKVSALGRNIAQSGTPDLGAAAGAAVKGQTLKSAAIRNVIERAPGAIQSTAMDQANNVDLPAGADPSSPAQAAADPSATDGSSAFGGLSQADVQAAMVQAVNNGDTKQLANLKTLNDSMSSAAATSASSSKMTAAQQKDYQAGTDALGYLKSMEQNLSNAGGAQGPAGAAATIPVLGQFLSPKGSAYQNTLVDTATALAKAMTGGKPSAQQIDQWKHSLPQFDDTPAAAQYKLANIRNALQNKMAGAGGQTSGSSSSTLADSLQSLIDSSSN